MRSYAIAGHETTTDDKRFLDRIGQLSECGVDLIQLRAKHLDDRDLLDLARCCRDRIGDGTQFLVNGRADIAIAAGADGVHLPADGIPVSVVRRLSEKLVVGRSCHSVDEVRRASEDGADLVVLGPLFETRTGVKESAITLDDLAEASRVDIQVFALGGFDRRRVAELEGSRVTGVAGIAMFMKDEPIAEIVNEIRQVRTS